ncbi:MAG: four helix bundle protein [Planctomycetes bacterium]|nr:four helix bundle protein [Planctomycetota bacterium]
MANRHNENPSRSNQDCRDYRHAGGRVDIDARTFEFANRVLKVVAALPSTVVGRTIGQQLARAGTAVGANVEEAQGGHSRREFARKMGIARGEAREARYWLRLVASQGLLSEERLSDIIGESDEILRILTAIVKKTRQNAD